MKHLFISDNLPVLRNMQNESVDLIYLDPPFNSGKQWGNPIEAHGRKAEVAFKDTWNLSDIHADEELELLYYAKDAIPLINSLHKINGGSWRAYLIYMGIRLAEMRRVLKPTGSIYYHCDPVMSHGVKLLMDCIFGKNNFRNELVWHYLNGGGRATRWLNRKHDIILSYAKHLPSCFYNGLAIGDKRTLEEGTFSGYFKTDENGRRYQEVRASGKIYKYYVDDPKNPDDVWQINVISQRDKTERTGYPTQKPLALLERIIKASSNEDDVVLDPFCGCATTCVAANNLKRQWIGVDLSDKAEHFIKSRISKESYEITEGTFEVNPTQERRKDLEKLDKDSVKANLFAKNKICPGCQREKELDDMDLDHIVAKTRGGQDEWRNFQLLCRNCNTSKGSKGMTEWRNDLMQRRIDDFVKQQILENQKWLAKQTKKRLAK